jgi:energy-coupling factor transport system permease protein
MNLLLPGMHVATDSPVHRLDPRVKTGATLLLMAMPFAAPDALSSALLSSFVLAIAVLSAAPLSALLRTLRTIFWLGFFMFFFYLFTTPGHPLVAWRGISMTVEGLLMGATQIYRLSLLVVLSSLLTFTTSASQLTQGLEALFDPLRRVGLPVRESTMVLTIALRFVPTLLDEVEKITKAQQARGADFRSRNPWRRVRSWVPTFVPIFVAAFRRADDLATAMEARGFRGARRRTHLRQLHLTRGDLLASVIVLGVSALIMACHRIV